MMKTKTSIWVAAAVAAGFAFGFAGCGDNNTMMPTTCTTDSQCTGAGEVCHPLLKSCVAGCTSANDCPDAAKKCATITGASAGGDGGVRGFCQCSTDALCDRGVAGQVCQDKSTLVCSAKCTASSGCPTGFTCDTATGKCGGAATDGGTDGGMDAGVTACTPGSCMGGQICDPTTSRCAAAAACASANAQPDTCVYGLFCSGAACAEAPRTGVTCGNFDMVATPKAWNPATVTPKGPVTHSFASITKDANMPLFCGARGADFSAEANLYAGNTNFPTMLDMVPANLLNYVRTDGQIIDVRVGMLARPTAGYSSGLSNNNKNLRLRFNLCVMGTVPATLVAGFYAENGNPVCATLQ
ncbi:MAG: hypothetical protein JNJ54_27000 [Myxococcaceae bacterium]|nr:hypothetical protein [Myxococcaceae bacterium]